MMVDENEHIGVMSMMEDDQETEEPEDVEKAATTAKEGTDDDIHNENELTGVMSMMVDDQEIKGDISVKDQDQSKESISNDLKTDFETWTDEEEKSLEHKYSENDEKAAVKDDQDDEESEAESKIFVDHEVKVEEDQGLTETNPADKISPIKVEAVLDYGGC